MLKILFLFALPIHLMVAGDFVKAQDRINPKQRYAYGCVIKNKYSVSQRLKYYPFSRAAKILAVSFKYGPPPPDADSTAKAYEYGLHVADSVLDQRSLIEIKQLSTAQINSLTNIMYNINTRSGKGYPDTGYSCFAARNALVFFDRNGKIFDYLEVCFECDQMRSQSDKIYFKENCLQLMDVFKQFFIDTGIQYGTIKK